MPRDAALILASCARTAGARAPGVRSHASAARHARGRGTGGGPGAPPGVPAGDSALLHGKEPPRWLLAMRKTWVPNPALPPATVCDLAQVTCLRVPRLLGARSEITAAPCANEAKNQGSWGLEQCQTHAGGVVIDGH